MPKHIIVACDLDRNPKHILAGIWGSYVAQTCWRLAKEIDRDGEITEIWSPEVLTARMCGGIKDVQNVRRGMERAIKAGLIEEIGGRVWVHDFLGHQTPIDPSGKRRAKEYRERKKQRLRAEAGCLDRDDRDASRDDYRDDTVTQPLRRDASRFFGTKNYDLRSGSRSTLENTSTIPPTTEPLLSTAPPEPAAHDAGTSLAAAMSLADDMRSELVAVRPKARLASPITWDNVRGAWAQALLPLLERDGLEHGRIMATWRATIRDQFELGNMLHPQAPARFAARFDELEAKREREPSGRAGARSSVENLIPGAFNFDLDKYLEEHPENAVEGWPGDPRPKEA